MLIRYVVGCTCRGDYQSPAPFTPLLPTTLKPRAIDNRPYKVRRTYYKVAAHRQTPTACGRWGFVFHSYSILCKKARVEYPVYFLNTLLKYRYSENPVRSEIS